MFQTLLRNFMDYHTYSSKQSCKIFYSHFTDDKVRIRVITFPRSHNGNGLVQQRKFHLMLCQKPNEGIDICSDHITK